MYNNLIEEDIMILDNEFFKIDTMFESVDKMYDIKQRELEYNYIYTESINEEYVDLYTEAEEAKDKKEQGLLGRLFTAILNFIRSIRAKILRLFGNDKKASELEAKIKGNPKLANQTVEITNTTDAEKAIDEGTSFFGSLIDKIVKGTATEKDADEAEEKNKSLLSRIAIFGGGALLAAGGAKVASDKLKERGVTKQTIKENVSNLLKREKDTEKKSTEVTQTNEQNVQKAQQAMNNNSQNGNEENTKAGRRIVASFKDFITDVGKFFTGKASELKSKINGVSSNNNDDKKKDSTKDEQQTSTSQARPKNTNTQQVNDKQNQKNDNKQWNQSIDYRKDFAERLLEHESIDTIPTLKTELERIIKNGKYTDEEYKRMGEIEDRLQFEMILQKVYDDRDKLNSNDQKILDTLIKKINITANDDKELTILLNKVQDAKYNEKKRNKSNEQQISTSREQKNDKTKPENKTDTTEQKKDKQNKTNDNKKDENSKNDNNKKKNQNQPQKEETNKQSLNNKSNENNKNEPSNSGKSGPVITGKQLFGKVEQLRKAGTPYYAMFNKTTNRFDYTSSKSGKYIIDQSNGYVYPNKTTTFNTSGTLDTDVYIINNNSIVDEEEHKIRLATCDNDFVLISKGEIVSAEDSVKHESSSFNLISNNSTLRKRGNIIMENTKVLNFIDELEQERRNEVDNNRFKDSISYKYNCLNNAKKDGVEECLSKSFEKFYLDAIPLNDEYKTANHDDLCNDVHDFIKKNGAKSMTYYVGEARKKSPVMKKLYESVEKLVDDKFKEKEEKINETKPELDLVFKMDGETEKKIDVINQDLELDDIAKVISDNVRNTAMSEINRAKEEKENMKQIETDLANDINVKSEAAIERELSLRGINQKAVFQPSLFEGIMIGKMNKLSYTTESTDDVYLYNAMKDYTGAFYEGGESATAEEIAFVESVRELTLLSMERALKIKKYSLQDIKNLANEYASMK